MTDPVIKVTANVAGVEAALRRVQDKIDGINSSMSDGLDVRNVQSSLQSLERDVKAVTDTLTAATKSGEKLTGLDMGAVTKTMKDATTATVNLRDVLKAVGQTSTFDATIKGATSVVSQLEKAIQLQKTMREQGKKISTEQADGFNRAFSQLSQSNTRGASHLRGTNLPDFLGGGYKSYSINQNESKAYLNNVLKSIGAPEIGAAGKMTAGAKWKAVGGMGAAFAGNLATGGGNGLFGGAGSLIGGGLGMALGGVPGAAIGSAIFGGAGGMVDRGVGESKNEEITLSNLRQSIGAATIGFDELQGSVRRAVVGLGLTYDESAKLAAMFKQTSNTANGAGIGREVGTAAGFGRGYGIAPEQTVQFMGAMRQAGVTGNERDSRRLALQIAEATQQGGTGGKMDEVLSSIQSFVQNATRMSLTSGSAGSYASFMSSMTGSGLYGLKNDPGNTANIMGNADAALRRGGAFGEASQNFSLGLWQNKLKGFSALDMQAINEQGAFGSIAKAFGAGSPSDSFMAAMGSRGDPKRKQYAEWAKAGGDRSILSMQMEGLENQFGLSPTMFQQSIMSHMGVGVGGSAGLYMAYQKDHKLGDLEGKLAAANISTDGMNPNRIGTLANAAYGDRAALARQSKDLLGLKDSDALSGMESGRLKAAMSGGSDDDLRKIVLELSNTHDLTKDEGERQRKVQADMNIAMQTLVKGLIPLTLQIKEGIVELVNVVSFGNSSWAREQKALGDKAKDNDLSGTALDDAISGLDVKIADHEKIRKNFGQKGGEEQYALDKARRASLVAQRSAQENNRWDNPNNAGEGGSRMDGGSPTPNKARPGMKLTDAELNYLLETDRLTGAKPGTSAAQIQVESGNDPEAVSPAGAWGLAQLMPDTKKEVERRVKHPIVGRGDQLEAHRILMQENVAKWGNITDAQRAYNGGWTPSKWGNPETSNYAGKINATRDMMPADAKVPGGFNLGSKRFEKQEVEVTSNSNVFLFNGLDGKSIGNTAVQTHNRLPSYAGSQF